MARNKDLKEEEAMKKINSQMPMDVKQAKSDIVVCNKGSKQDLEKTLVKDTVPSILKSLQLDPN